jgi:WD40 repeat protein
MKLFKATILLIILSFCYSLSVGQSYEFQKKLEGHKSAVTSITLRNEDGLLVSGDQKGEIRVWDIEQGKTDFILKGHKDKITHLVFSSNGKKLVSASYDGTIRIWDLKSQKSKQFSCASVGSYNDINGNEPTFVLLDSEDGYLYYGGYQMKVIRINLKTGKEKILFKNNEYGITAGIFSQKRKYLIFGYADKIHFWDLKLNKTAFILQKDLDDDFDNYVCELQSRVGNKGEQIAVWNYAGKIDFWNLKSKNIDISLDGTNQEGSSEIALSDDGMFLLSGNINEKTKLWDLNSKSVKQVLDGHTGPTNTFKFGRNNEFIITGSQDKTINIWHLIKQDFTSGNKIPKIIRNRKVEIQEVLDVSCDSIQIHFWDKQVVDGDIISVNINGEWILQRYVLDKYHRVLKIAIPKGENYLIIHAHNEGSMSPNTIALKIDDGIKPKFISLYSDIKKSSAIIINNF